MTSLEQAVMDAALKWADEVTTAMQGTGLSDDDQLGEEELALYEAVCAWRAAQGD